MKATQNLKIFKQILNYYNEDLMQTILEAIYTVLRTL